MQHEHDLSNEPTTRERATGAHPILETVRHELRMRMLTVTHVERPTPALVRVRLAGPDLEGFAAVGPADHVKVFVPAPGSHRAEVPVLGPGGVVAGSRPAAAGRGRDYTPRFARLPDGELELDFVLHPGGVASSWAATAEVGDVLGIGGPRGSQRIRSDVDLDGFVLAGDETALPAIANWLAAVPAGVPVRVLAEVATSADRQELSTHGALDLTWLERGDEPRGASVRLAKVAADAARPGGRVWHWAAAEATVAATIRRGWLDRGVDEHLLAVRGYWKLAAADHQEPHED